MMRNPFSVRLATDVITPAGIGSVTESLNHTRPSNTVLLEEGTPPRANPPEKHVVGASHVSWLQRGTHCNSALRASIPLTAHQEPKHYIGITSMRILRGLQTKPV